MARKLVAPAKKWDAVIRILEGKDDTANAARRLGVSQKAVQAWRREYLDAHPEAKRLEDKPPPPPPPPVQVPSSATVSNPVISTGDKVSIVVTKPTLDKAAVDAALAADGGVGKPPTTTAGAPGSPAAAVIVSTEAEDMAVVEGVGNQVMGLAARAIILFYEMKSKVTVPMTERIQRLFILTPTEVALLKPASRHLAAKIRELIGSDEKVAFAVGGSTIGTGLMDRARVIGEAVAEAVRLKPPPPLPEVKK